MNQVFACHFCNRSFVVETNKTTATCPKCSTMECEELVSLLIAANIIQYREPKL